MRAILNSRTSASSVVADAGAQDVELMFRETGA